MPIFRVAPTGPVPTLDLVGGESRLRLVSGVEGTLEISTDVNGYLRLTDTGLSATGTVTDNAGAVAHSFDTTLAVTAAGAKLLSIRNNAIEKLSVDKDGGVTTAATGYAFSGPAQSTIRLGSALLTTNAGGTAWHVGSPVILTGSNSLSVSGVVSSNTFRSYDGASTPTLQGNIADGATSVGVIINNSVTLVAAGAKVLSIRNNGSELAYVDRNGLMMSVAFWAGSTGAGNVYAGGVLPGPSQALSLQGTVPDSAAAVGVIVSSSNALSTAGAKLLSIRNNGAEKAYIDKDGAFVISGTPDGNDAITIPQGKRLSMGGTGYLYSDGNTIQVGAGITGAQMNATGGIFSSTSAAVTLRGMTADGASAVAGIINSYNTLATAGSKLVSFRNNTVEKAYIDWDGAFWGKAGLATDGNLSFTSANATPIIATGYSVAALKFRAGSNVSGVAHTFNTGTDAVLYSVGTDGAFNFYAGPATAGVTLQPTTLHFNSKYWSGTGSVTYTGALKFETQAAAPVGKFSLQFGGSERMYIGSAGVIGTPDGGTFRTDGAAAGVSRTNLVRQSQTFDSATWVKGSTGAALPTVTPDTTVAPDGTTTADTLTFGAVTAGQAAYISQGSSIPGAGVVTFSIWLKAAVAGQLYLYTAFSGFNSVTLIDVTTEWKRFSTTCPSAGAGTLYTYIGCDALSAGTPMTAKGAITLYAWGAQVEMGYRPTRYIPTTTAAASATSHDALTVTTAVPLTAGKLLSVQNGDLEKAYITLEGSYVLTTGLWDDVPCGINEAGGASGLTTELYRDTQFTAKFMRHDQDDTLSLEWQMPHSWDPSTSVKPHIHWEPQVNPGATQVVRFTGKYAWTQAGVATPADASWTAFTVDVNVGTTDAFIQKVTGLATVAPPSNPKESNILLMWLRRPGNTDGTDTYTTGKATGTAAANIMITSIDAHYQKVKLGSVAEIP